MFDQVARDLRTWVHDSTAVAENRIVFTPPGSENGTISLYLWQVVRTLSTGEHHRNAAPAKVTLHYLISIADDDPLEAHRLLGTLMFAALENPAFEVALEPLPFGAWQAFGQIPQPAFVVKIPVRRERTTPDVPLVQKPLNVRSTQR